MNHTFYFSSSKELAAYLNNMMYHVRLIAKNELVDGNISILFQERKELLSDNYYDCFVKIANSPEVVNVGQNLELSNLILSLNLDNGESLIRMTNNPNGYTVTEYDVPTINQFYQQMLRLNA